MVKIGFLFGLLGLLLLANTCSAAVELTVTPVNTTTVEPGGTISYYVNLRAMDNLGANQTERLSIQTQLTGWGYSFDPGEFILKNAGDSMNSILTIKVPDNIQEGNYKHKVVADGFQYLNDDNITLEIHVEHDESNIDPNVQVPEFPSIVLPVAAVLGLVAVFGRRKE